MLSRITQLTISCTFFLTLGCGLKLGEKNKTANVLEIKGASCLTKSIDQLKLFFAGDATDEQLTESLMCVQEVLLTFKDNVRGQEQNSYTPEEISKYIAAKFSKSGSAISTDFLVEIFKLKVLIAGGTSDKLTKAEIEALVSIIGRLKPEVVRLNPHMKVIVSKWTAPADAAMKEKKFIEAKAAFEAFLNRVALLLASTGRVYEMSDLLNLAIEAIRSGNGSADTIKLLSGAKNLTIKFKMTLIGGSEVIENKEWVPFAKTLGGVYFQALRIKYFYQDLKEEQVAEKWKVYEQVVVDVSTLAHDLLVFKNSTLLKNSEITALLEAAKPLLSELVINAELTNQIGTIKVMFLGNHADGQGAHSWSVNDFKNLNVKAPVLLKNISVVVQNLKHLKVDKTGFRKNEIKYEDFTRAEGLIKKAVFEITEQIQDSYDLVFLKNLIVVLSETLLKDSLKLPDNFAGLMAVVNAAKYTLTGEPGTLLTKLNIQLFLNVGIHAYANYVEFVNYVSVFNLEEKEFASAFDRLFKKVKETLGLELRLKANHMISSDEFSQLILTAQTHKFLKAKFDQKSLTSLFSALWENILNKPEDRLAEKSLPGLNAQALQAIGHEMHYWIENQKVIAEIFALKQEFTKAELITELSKKSRSASTDELIKVVSAPGLMNFNDKGFLKILTETNGVYHVKDLNNTNLTRSLARFVIRGYANDLDRVNRLGGVTQEELQYGFDQLKDFIVSLDLVDPVNTFVASRFREANLFLTVSNGDKLGSFEEINHLVLHILSGISRADSLTIIAMEKCLKVKNEIISKSELGQNCLLDLYFNEENSFSELPGFAKLKVEKDDKGELKVTPEQNKMYYLSLLKAAGYIPNDKVPEEERTVRLSDANLFPHVVQYVEMIFFSHDTNRDAYLQKEEAIKAFPIFTEVMKPVQKQFSLEDKDLVGLFVWLLKKGTVFPINNMKKFVKDHECNLNQDSKTCAQDWTINASRIDLGKIFNLIALLTAPKPPAPEPGPAPAPTPDP